MTHDPHTIRIVECDASTDPGKFSRLGVETFVQAFGDLYSQEDLDAFLKAQHSAGVYRKILDDPALRTWLAETEEGDAVGYVIAGPCDLPAPDMPENAGELKRIYILKDYQGGGLGRRMLDTAFVWLEDKFAHLYIGVYSENFGAQRLYARYGFEKVGEYDFMVGNTADLEFIMMRKKAALRMTSDGQHYYKMP